MCMKYVNVTVDCYQSVIKLDNNSILSLNGPCDAVKFKKIGDRSYIGGFFVVTHVNLLGTNKEENKDKSLLERKGKLEVTVRLTRCDKVEDRQIGFDLDKFVVDPYSDENKNNIHKACFPYFNYKRVTQVNNVELPLGEGTYVIKVLVRDLSEERQTIQAMTYLRIASED